VGAGTVYRHFGSKDELTTAVALMRLRAITSTVEAVLDPDPETCLVQRLTTVFEGLLEDMGLLLAVGERLTASEEHPAVRRALLLALEQALTAAQSSGAVRTDVTAEDLLSLVGRLATHGKTTADQARRHFVLALDALRPVGTRPLPVAPGSDH
jgi:AcrR family transcriptional regulator